MPWLKIARWTQTALLGLKDKVMQSKNVAEHVGE